MWSCPGRQAGRRPALRLRRQLRGAGQRGVPGHFYGLHGPILDAREPNGPAEIGVRVLFVLLPRDCTADLRAAVQLLLRLRVEVKPHGLHAGGAAGLRGLHAGDRQQHLQPQLRGPARAQDRPSPSYHARSAPGTSLPHARGVNRLLPQLAGLGVPADHHHHIRLRGHLHADRHGPQDQGRQGAHRGGAEGIGGVLRKPLLDHATALRDHLRRPALGRVGGAADALHLAGDGPALPRLHGLCELRDDQRHHFLLCRDDPSGGYG
mmetsp:Transcript_85422/g.242165  ORF Transcript_85422/g.242165 Transcript_85422/m.242165 type:complete len:264 (-) Transcript_85422:588-1379(-)